MVGCDRLTELAYGKSREAVEGGSKIVAVVIGDMRFGLRLAAWNFLLGNGLDPHYGHDGIVVFRHPSGGEFVLVDVDADFFNAEYFIMALEPNVIVASSDCPEKLLRRARTRLHRCRDNDIGMFEM